MPAFGKDSLRALVECAPEAFIVHDETGRILDVNQTACRRLGYSRDELLAMNMNDISRGFAPADNLRRWSGAAPGSSLSIAQVARRRDGTTYPVEVSSTCQVVDGRKMFLGFSRDVSEREEARRKIERLNADLEQRIAERTGELQRKHERLLMAARIGGLGIWDYDIRTAELVCDEQWHRIMGRDPALPVRSLAEFRPFIHPEDVARVTEVDATAARLLLDGGDYVVVFRIVLPDGSLRWVRSVAQVLDGPDGKAARAVGFVMDVTNAMLEEKRLRDANRALVAEREVLARHSEELSRQVLEDPLTGLANRRRLADELARACQQAARDGGPLSLMMIDVDFFKSYNDRYGHARGDAALVTVARVLAAAVQRPYDLVARYGGEEFLLLMPGIDRPEPVFERLVEGLAAARIVHDGSAIASHLTVSGGCAVAARLDAVCPEELIVLSDKALYRAKESGRNRLVVLQT